MSSRRIAARRRLLVRALGLLVMMTLALPTVACASVSAWGRRVDSHLPGGSSATGTTLPDGTKLSLVSPGRLTVCVRLSAPPRLHPAATGVAGFDADVLGLIGQQFNLPLSFVPIVDTGPYFAGALVANGTCDLMAGGGLSPGNAQAFGLTEPYFKDRYALVLPAAGTARSMDDLAGRRVAYVTAYRDGADVLNAYNTTHGRGVVVVPENDLVLTLNALDAKQIDAAVIPNYLAYYWATQRALRVPVEVGPTWEIGFGLQKDNSALREHVNGALSGAVASGRYQAVYQKWFGRAPDWLPGQ